MYEFYNPHPSGKLVGDCVKRALTKASGKTYQEVSKELNAIKREIGASDYSSNSVWRKYLKDKLIIESYTFNAVKGEPRMCGEQFCQDYPEGVYILNMARHLSCVVDGVIYDTWDCSDKCVYTAWKVVGIAESVNPVKDIRKSSKKSAANVPQPSVREDGNVLMDLFSKITEIPCKVTRKGERWIPLTKEKYADVLEELLQRKYLRCKNRRGSLTSTWWDERNGMTIILKQGDSPYVWCTVVGSNK